MSYALRMQRAAGNEERSYLTITECGTDDVTASYTPQIRINF